MIRSMVSDYCRWDKLEELEVGCKLGLEVGYRLGFEVVGKFALGVVDRFAAVLVGKASSRIFAHMPLLVCKGRWQPAVEASVREP